MSKNAPSKSSDHAGHTTGGDRSRRRHGGEVKRIRIAAQRVMFLTAIALAVAGESSLAAAQLRDSTRIPIRLVGGITSETTQTGQALHFVVMSDIVVNDEIVIRKDTPVVGVVVKARRVRLGFTRHRPKLAFRFSYTTTLGGQVIALRSSPVRQVDDQVVVQRGTPGHAMLWTGGADIFDAYVDGDYEI
jgi:hypothetical protein